nr:TOMM precursor leader peptide-binding protein [Cohnella sp. CFH 77786]
MADRVSDRLGTAYKLIRQIDFRDGAPQEADLALVLSDGWAPGLHAIAEETFRRMDTPWIRGFVSFGEGIAGPLVRPDVPGCSLCADSRKAMAGRDRRETWLLRERFTERQTSPRDVWASNPGILQLALILAEESERLLRGDPVRLENRMYLLNLTTLTLTRHFILPDPLCPVCGRLPDDSPADARIALRESRKTGAGSYRTRPMEQLEKTLESDYLDYRTGLLNVKMYDLQSPYADASVNLPLPQGDEGTAGRTHRYSDSVLTAILEGLERHCGLQPRGKRTSVRGTYRQLEEFALFPARVGLHAAEQYARPDFPFQAFDPERNMNWVWGYSFLEERPILLPEPLVYYGTGCGQGFVYETSNGCALGGSLEEAIFYGILEVAERDSFLLAWYARLPLTPLDPHSSGDAELSLMVDRLRETAGFEVLLFDSTMEHGIPCIWSMAKNTGSRGVNLICAAGAHPDPVRAAKSSIHELAGMVLSQNERFEANRETYALMLEDPYRVRQMEDHSMLYALPEAERRFDFLLKSGRRTQTFGETFARPVWHPDMTEDLKALISVFRRLGLDVIAVDQTSPETLRNGLHCVKVLIPGMLPMTFGYHLTRLQGLDRVLRVPAALGFVPEPLTLEELNPHPHPFP